MIDKSKYKQYEIKRLIEIADIERAKKGKIYPAGCTLIALSATKGVGDNKYHEADGEVEPRYAVIRPRIEILPKYLFISIQVAFSEFYQAWHTGINLQIDKLEFLKVKIHELEAQATIVEFYKKMTYLEEKEEQLIQKAKNVKKGYLDKLFPR